MTDETETKRLIEACCDNPYDDKSREALATYIANLQADVSGLRDAAQIYQGEIVQLRELVKALEENREWARDKLEKWERLLALEADRATCRVIRMALSDDNPKLIGVLK